MSRILIQDNGKIRKYEDIELAEKVVQIRNKKDPWAVIDHLIKLWVERAPDEEEAIKINIDEYREVQKDKVYGQTLLGKDQERRFTIAFPRSLMLMIRTQYKAEELPMDKKFYKEFARRYPAFKVAQKV